MTTDSNKLINDLTFSVIDLETTGGNHSSDKIIEIGIVKIVNCKIVDEFSYLINPEIKIPEFIQKLTNISQDQIKDSPTIESVIDEITDFVGDSIIVAHNISFDVPFLNSVLKRQNKPNLENKLICTNVMTKYLLPEIMNSNLNYLSTIFGIDHKKAHRAIQDAKATAELLIKYLDIFKKKNIRKVNQLYYPRNKFELDRAHFDKGDDFEMISNEIKACSAPLVIYIKGENGLLLSVIPLDNPKKEFSLFEEILKSCKWEMISLRLVGPMLEGLLQLNLHYNKLPEKNQQHILGYLIEKYEIDPIKHNLNSLLGYDFVISQHLISDQLVLYNFFNFNHKSKLIFKYPNQKKKLNQQVNSHISRFEGTQKGRKKVQIIKELVPLFAYILEDAKKSGNYLFLDRKDIKKIPNHLFDEIEKFTKNTPYTFKFPEKHL
jgi:DNA polymerase-3 subunit epsilon